MARGPLIIGTKSSHGYKKSKVKGFACLYSKTKLSCTPVGYLFDSTLLEYKHLEVRNRSTDYLVLLKWFASHLVQTTIGTKTGQMLRPNVAYRSASH